MLIVGAPALGLALRLVLFPVGEWASEHVPVFRALTKFLTSSDSRWDTVGFAVAGVVVGIAFAVAAIRETLAMTLTNHQLESRKKGVCTTISRGDVSAAFMDGKQLVLVGQQSEELVRGVQESESGKVGAAFREHRWPWADTDPHAEQFRRWVPDLPDLPPAVNALLASRGRALDKGDATGAADLRAEVARLRYVIRDERKRQYWRPTSS